MSAYRKDFDKTKNIYLFKEKMMNYYKKNKIWKKC